MHKKFDIISVVIFILLMDLFFYLGTTVTSSKLGSIQTVTLIFQITSSLATVVGVIFACKAYFDWNSRVTHPDKYERDSNTVKALDKIHHKCKTFSYVRGCDIESIFNQFDFYLQQDDGNKGGLVHIENQWDGLREEYRESLSFELHTEFLDNVLESSVDVFSNTKNKPCLVNYGYALKGYLTAASDICTRPLSDSRVKHLPYLNHKHHIKVNDLAINGRAFINLENARAEVKSYYEQSWS